MATQEEAVQAVYKYAAELVRSGMSAAQIETRLREKGLEPSIASTVTRNIFAIRSKAMKEAGKKNMLYGALWCIGGIVVTVGTMAFASGGGSYIIAWGAILFGFIQFIRGLWQTLSNQA